MPVITAAKLGQDLLFTDGLYDIGKAGATRPRDGFFSRNLTASGLVTVNQESGADGRGVRYANTSNAQTWETRIGRAGLENTSWTLKDITGGVVALTIASGAAGLAEFGGGVKAANAILDQGAADGEILALRSSDVAHGMTSVTSTDTFGRFTKASATEGGLVIYGLTETLRALYLEGSCTTEDATRSTAAVGAIYLNSDLKSGTSVTAMSADKNMVVFTTNGVARHILDTDGDSHQDVGTAWTNFDSHDDVALLNLMAAHVARPDDPLRDSFRVWLEQSREELERIRLVSFNEDGHHFVNMSRLAMLSVGAIRQLADRIERMEHRMNPLPAKV